MKIPYLNNMSPIEILKTKDGKEKLENLLRDIENESKHSTDEHLHVFPVKKIRKRLSL